jgi:polysaccharide pyruvyl transferase WcaK-like protein
MAIKNIDKSYIELKGNRLSDSSMIKMFNILQDEDDEYFMNMFKTFIVDPTVLNEGTNLQDATVVDPWWENVAFTSYKDVDLWWLLCVTNDVINPYEELSEGDKISILKQQFIPYVHRDMERIYTL